MTQFQNATHEELRAYIYNYMRNLPLVKNNPYAMQRLSLELLEKATKGEVNIVDPTNPFMFLLESSVINTSYAISEYYINLRKQYPELSTTKEDLYLHMSDRDFINIFSSPATCVFTVAVLLKDIVYNDLYDPTDKSYKLILPRGSKVTIENFTFTFLYPIVIKRFDNGFIQVSYDISIKSELFEPTGNIIDYTIQKDLDGKEWLFFDITLKQLTHTGFHLPVDDMNGFFGHLAFKDQFNWAEVYFKANSSGNWIRLNSIFNEVNYNYNSVTAILKVVNDKLYIKIPNFYQLAIDMTGSIRVDVYSSKGSIDIDMSSYKLSDYGFLFDYINEGIDYNIYVDKMKSVQFYIFSKERVNDGRNSITFDELKQRVIENSLGNYIKTPITHIQLKNSVYDNGFELTEHINDITRKTILAVRRLPKADVLKYITEANAGVYTYLFTVNDINDNYKIRNYDIEDSITIMSNCIFVEENGKLRMLSLLEVNSIKSLSPKDLVNYVNTKHIVVNPFYYVIDKKKDYDAVRLYELDTPTISSRSIEQHNETLQLIVHTGSIEIFKEENGYRIDIITKSGSNYKNLSDSEVGCQLVFNFARTTEMLYINATFVEKLPSGERSFTAFIPTNYYLDEDDYLFTDGLTPYGESLPRPSKIKLKDSFQIIYTTSNIINLYKRSSMDDIINYAITSTNFVAISLDKINYILGYNLKNIYRRVRNFLDSDNYEVYTEDVPLTYEEDVYEIDPTTGSIFTINSDGTLTLNITHKAGDIVYDNAGNIVYKYRKGDVKLDENGNPILLGEEKRLRELDLYLLEGQYFFIDKPEAKAYINKIRNTVVDWSINDLERIKLNSLELTNLYYYPRTTLNVIPAIDEYNILHYIRAPQSLKIKIWLHKLYFYDTVLKNNIKLFITSYINANITEYQINLNNAISDIKLRFPEQIYLVDIENLGGKLNRKSFRVQDTKKRMCLGKKLFIDEDGTIDITEDIEYSFLIV